MDRYDVIVQALDEGADPARAARAVGQVLGASAGATLARLEALPATVREDVDEREAESLLHALREAGARVRLKKRSTSRAALPRSGSTPAPPRASGPPPSRSVRPLEIDLEAPSELPLPDLPLPLARPAAALVAAPMAAVAAIDAVEEEILPARFWSALPGALVYPLRGPGKKFLAIGMVLSPLLPIALVVASILRFWGVGLLLAVSATWLGFLLAWFRACCFATMTGGAEPEDLPDASTWRERVQEGGFLLFVLCGLVMLGVLVGASAARGAEGLADAGTQGKALLLLYALVGLYWPLGVGLLAARGSMLAFFDFTVAIRAVAQVPLQLLAVLALSGIAQALSGLALVAVAQAAALTSSGEGPSVAGLVVLALAALPSAYVHAVMGTAMGLLFRTRPHVFM